MKIADEVKLYVNLKMEKEMETEKENNGDGDNDGMVESEAHVDT